MQVMMIVQAIRNTVDGDGCGGYVDGDNICRDYDDNDFLVVMMTMMLILLI